LRTSSLPSFLSAEAAAAAGAGAICARRTVVLNAVSRHSRDFKPRGRVGVVVIEFDGFVGKDAGNFPAG